jgi:hypothetical protein
MLGQAIWWGSILLEALLLAQGFRTKLFSRYPVFYGYLLFVWSQDVLRLLVYHLQPQLYVAFYWSTEGLGVLVGCGVVFEIYRVGLAPYPGAARLARNLLAFVFVLAFTKAIVDTWNDPHWWSVATNGDLERALRTVQTLAILSLVCLFLLYSIPFGKNLRGILLGYGLFVSLSAIQLTFIIDKTTRFHAFWSYLSPGSYFAVLGLWLVHLWSYAPNPDPKRGALLEEQYQMVAAATSRRLQQARGYLGRAVRP